MIELYKAMEYDLELAEEEEGAIQMIDSKYHLNLKKMKGAVDPYSAEAKQIMTEAERFRYQKLWCLMTNAIPKVGKKRPEAGYLTLEKDSYQ